MYFDVTESTVHALEKPLCSSLLNIYSKNNPDSKMHKDDKYASVVNKQKEFEKKHMGTKESQKRSK
jgi:hypothetical protein